MGNFTSYTEIKTDKIKTSYKKGSSRYHYVAIIYEDDEIIKKKFRTKEAAENWLKSVRFNISSGNKDLVFKMINSYS